MSIELVNPALDVLPGPFDVIAKIFQAPFRDLGCTYTRKVVEPVAG